MNIFLRDLLERIWRLRLTMLKQSHQKFGNVFYNEKLSHTFTIFVQDITHPRSYRYCSIFQFRAIITKCLTTECIADNADSEIPDIGYDNNA